MHYSKIPDNEALFNISPWRIFGHQNPGHVREKPQNLTYGNPILLVYPTAFTCVFPIPLGEDS